ncbi:MAG: PLP-dependent aminotransferase family protein [Pseudomonadota bacterium]
MARHTDVPLDILAVDPSSPLPAYRQLCDAIRSAILERKLRSGLRLPASRLVAKDLSISRNTVISAYETLISEGYLETRRGSGTFVASLPESAMHIRNSQTVSTHPGLSRRGMVMGKQPLHMSQSPQVAFYPGYPDLRQFPFAVWSRLVKANVKHASRDLIGYSMIGGHPRLKSAIAHYLGAARGIECSPEQVIIVTGTQAALDLVARMLLDPGDHVWIEEPGYEGAHGAFVGAGGVPVPLKVDGGGWQFPRDAMPPRAIFVTPSCQWPTGAVMTLEERLTLLKIAAAQDCWIVEDDYDAEYRFRGRSIPAMQGLDRSGRVIYLGTFAKTIFPSLRIGFIVVPEKLVASFTHAVNITGQHPPQLMQLTLADFLEQGSLSAHLRRTRSLYRARKEYFIEQVEAHLSPWLTLAPSDAGIQMVARFRGAFDDGDVKAAAMLRHVQFRRLSRLYRHSTPHQGMICGYAASDEAECRTAVRALQNTLHQLDSSAI